MSVITQYNAAIERGDIHNDAVQRDVLHHLQRLSDELSDNSRSWFVWRKKTTVKGLYIYGPVGVGKTYLVDLFYESVAEKKKARFHFHHFMQQIDRQLRQLQGQKDPLKQIAKNISQTTRLLCFDEFLVYDVAYAMILAELLQNLHNHGVILVISSNTAPDDLYLNGVQRARFLPAIEIIKNSGEVLNLNKHNDYRLGREPLVEAYLFPLNDVNKDKMAQQFVNVAKNHSNNGSITIQNRTIPYIQCSDKCIWFDFNVLCNLPRSQLDYLEIAERFDTVFVSAIPRLTENHTAQTIMFIHLIDVLYDRGINLVVSAAVDLESLYMAGEMNDAFKRTKSRLTEMQSVDYQYRHPRRVIHDML